MPTLSILVLLTSATLLITLIKIDRSTKIPVLISAMFTLYLIPMVLLADDVPQEQAVAEAKAKTQQETVEKSAEKPEKKSRKGYLLDDNGQIIEGVEVDPENPDLETAMKAMKIIEDRRRAEEVAKQEFRVKAEELRLSKGGKNLKITGSDRGPEFVVTFIDSEGNIHETLWVRIKDMKGDFSYKVVRTKIYPTTLPDVAKKSKKD